MRNLFAVSLLSMQLKPIIYYKLKYFIAQKYYSILLKLAVF